MTETPTPAQDLAAGDDPFSALPYPQLFAAIDTVEAMAHRTPFNAGDSVREDFHACLNRLRRKVVKVQQAMEWASVRGACGTSPHASFLAGWEAALRTAPASARIVWPSPETAETPDRGSADDTATRIDTAADETADWETMTGHVPVALLSSGHIAYRMDCWWREIGLDGRDRGNLLTLPADAVPMVAEVPPSAREKILADER